MFEPTAAALAAIEAEWPVIEAELAVVDAECQMVLHPSELTHRAHRRAVANLRRTLREQNTTTVRLAVVKTSLKSVA